MIFHYFIEAASRFAYAKVKLLQAFLPLLRNDRLHLWIVMFDVQVHEAHCMNGVKSTRHGMSVNLLSDFLGTKTVEELIQFQSEGIPLAHELSKWKWARGILNQDFGSYVSYRKLLGQREHGKPDVFFQSCIPKLIYRSLRFLLHVVER